MENISLRYMDRESIVLQNGDVVHRHMTMEMVFCLIDNQVCIECRRCVPYCKSDEKR